MLLLILWKVFEGCPSSIVFGVQRDCFPILRMRVVSELNVWVIANFLNDIRVGLMVRFARVPKYAILATSISANSSRLSMVLSRTILSSKPPKVTVDPTVTFGPSGPQRFLDSQLAKRAWMGKGNVQWLRTMYWFGVIVKV